MSGLSCRCVDASLDFVFGAVVVKTSGSGKSEVQNELVHDEPKFSKNLSNTKSPVGRQQQHCRAKKKRSPTPWPKNNSEMCKDKH